MMQSVVGSSFLRCARFASFLFGLHTTMQRNLRTLCTLLATAGLFSLTNVAMASEGVRPEIGRPLQQASELLKAGKGKEALAKAREAEAVGNRTPAEQLTIDRMKAAAAQRANDLPTAIAALEAIHPKVSGTEAAQVAEQIASAYAQSKNNAKASEWLSKATQGGYTSPSLKQLQTYLQSASGDYAAIAKDMAAAVAAAEQAGKKPDEGDLQRLADAYQRTGNSAGNATVLEKLVTLYPKKDYWNAYLARLPRKPGFSDRYTLDVMRVKMANGLISKTDEYFEMAQLALQANQPAEAKAIIEKGFAAKALGVGADGERHKRLADLADKKLSEAKPSLDGNVAEAQEMKDGNMLVKVGMGYVGAADYSKGISLIEAGIAKGGLKNVDEAKLRLGLAQIKAGNKAKGQQTLRSVGGNDGAADIARLWLMLG